MQHKLIIKCDSRVFLDGVKDIVLLRHLGRKNYGTSWRCVVIATRQNNISGFDLIFSTGL
jgi:hypothetical protein